MVDVAQELFIRMRAELQSAACYAQHDLLLVCVADRGETKRLTERISIRLTVTGPLLAGTC
eukprot:2864569-Prorocentrum_lima.AAC.1